MFKGLGNLPEMLKQARRVHGEMERIRDELKELVLEGSAGGGMVKVHMNGKMELLDCKIQPEVLADRDTELLEDLIVAAVNQALEKSQAVKEEKFGQLIGQAGAGLNIPGLSDVLTQLGGAGPGS